MRGLNRAHLLSWLRRVVANEGERGEPFRVLVLFHREGRKRGSEVAPFPLVDEKTEAVLETDPEQLFEKLVTKAQEDADGYGDSVEYVLVAFRGEDRSCPDGGSFPFSLEGESERFEVADGAIIPSKSTDEPSGRGALVNGMRHNEGFGRLLVNSVLDLQRQFRLKAVEDRELQKMTLRSFETALSKLDSAFAREERLHGRIEALHESKTKTDLLMIEMFERMKNQEHIRALRTEESRAKSEMAKNILETAKPLAVSAFGGMLANASPSVVEVVPPSPATPLEKLFETLDAGQKMALFGVLTESQREILMSDPKRIDGQTFVAFLDGLTEQQHTQIEAILNDAQKRALVEIRASVLAESGAATNIAPVTEA